MNSKQNVMGAVAAVLVAGSTLVFAQSGDVKKPLGKMSCADFLAFEDHFKPKVVYWAVARSQSGKPESAGVNVAGIEKIVPIIMEKCKKAPKESFWEKVKAEVKKLEKEM